MKRVWVLVLLLLCLLMAGCSAFLPSKKDMAHREAMLCAWNPFPERTVIGIWDCVEKWVRYKRDANGDHWQSPEYTFNHQVGDCEDINMLLACALRGAGFDACIVVGATDPAHRWIDHAWVLLVIDGTEYYCDATRDAPQSLERWKTDKWEGWVVRYYVR